MGIVTEYIRNLIAKQVDDNGLVVWYDPDGIYSEVVEETDLPNTTVICYKDSFVYLRWEIDHRGLMDGEDPPRLVVYVPMAQDQTHHALIELEAAGVIMQPGQQPPFRNTRLAVVARNALMGVLGDETAAHVEKQAEAGKLSLADLNALADKGGEISKGVLALIFGTDNPQEVALSFLDSDRLDESITTKDAKGELAELLRRDFGFDTPDDENLAELHQRFARHVLMTDFISGLGDAVPSKLSSVPVATTPGTADTCIALAQAWRFRRDRRESYVAASLLVEQEFGLAVLAFDPETIMEVETFPAIERALLRHVENRLLEHIDGDMLTLAESRLSRFWCDVEPRLQARWALVASAAEVLLEAHRIEQALKKAPTSITGLIREYAESTQPWCVLDTYHRNMESRWHNFEPLGDDHDSSRNWLSKADSDIWRWDPRSPGIS